MQGGGRRRQRIVDHLATLEANVVVLGEFMASDDNLLPLLKQAGFHHQIWGTDPAGGYASVLIASTYSLAPGGVDLSVTDSAARWVHMTVGETGWDVAGCIIPGSGGGKTLSRKLEFWDAILDAQSEPSDRPTMITGDFNTGQHYLDENGAKLSAADRFEAMLERGWADAFRSLHGNVRSPSWWSRPYNNGFRLDHALISPDAPAPIGCRYDTTDANGTVICGPGKGMLSDHAILVPDLPDIPE